MKYEVIARRYRPRRFEEVVGQESIARTLRGAILQERLAHAYLFAGPRGVGKTSMARIFAKAINCPEASRRDVPSESWGVSCDECSTCRAIHLGHDMDVIEMDGASHRGIEDIRAIIEGVNRPASRCPYKVYLIDEVHMLTREAFNALLKTLEEPPAHVKFIFATTEAHKIPDTVLSRCQRFEFQPIGEEAIVRRLAQICSGEGREASEDLLLRVARYSRGGLRDSQTLLDQLMTFADGELTSDDLDRLTGRVASSSIEAIAVALIDREPTRVLAGVRDAFRAGADPAILLEQIVEQFHRRLVEAVVEGRSPEARAVTGDGDGDADEALIDTLSGGLQVLLATASRLRQSAYPEIAVEVALLRLSRLEDPRSFERSLARLEELAAGGGAGLPVAGAPGGRPSPAGAAPSRSGPAASPVAGARAAWEARGAPVARDSGAPARRDVARAEPPSRADGSPSAPPPRSPPGPDPRAPRASVVPGARPAAGVAAPAGAGSETVVGLVERPGGEADSASRSVPSAPSPSAGVRSTVGCDRARLERLWEQSVIETKRKNPGLGVLLDHVSKSEPSSESDLLVLRVEDEFRYQQLRRPARVEELQTILRDVTGEPWRVRVDLVTGAGARTTGSTRAPDRGASGGASAAPTTSSRDPAAGDPAAGRPAAGGPGGSSSPGASSGPTDSDRVDPDPDPAGARTVPPSAPPGGAERAPGRRAAAPRLSEHPVVLKAKDIFHGRIV